MISRVCLALAVVACPTFADATVAAGGDGFMVLRAGGSTESTPLTSMQRVVAGGEWGIAAMYALVTSGDWKVGPDIGLSFGAGFRPWGGFDREGPMYADLMLGVGVRAVWRYSGDLQLGARIGGYTGTSSFRGSQSQAFGVGMAGPSVSIGAVTGEGHEAKGVELGLGMGSGSSASPFWHVFAIGTWPLPEKGTLFDSYLARFDLRVDRGAQTHPTTEVIFSFGWGGK